MPQPYGAGGPQQPPYPQNQQPPYPQNQPAYNQAPPVGRPGDTGDTGDVGDTGDTGGSGGGPGKPKLPPVPAWGSSEPPEPPRSFLTLMAIIGAVIIVLGGGAAVAVAMSTTGDQPKRPAAAASSPAPGPTYSQPTSAPSVMPSPSTSDPVINDPALTAAVGSCLKNTGTASNPNLIPGLCRRGNFKLLGRFLSTTNGNKCEKVAGATSFYKADNTSTPSLSYVDCLHQL